MSTKQPGDFTQETQETASQNMRPILPLPFPVQLRNILPAEIMVTRYPISDPASEPFAKLNITNIIVDPEKLKAQAVLEVDIDFPKGPRLCDISFKLVGLFTYDPNYSPEKVREFLEEGSMSVLLPSARELLLSLSTRLQLGPIMLPLAQIDPGTTETE